MRIKEIFDGRKLKFTSDLHYGHERVIEMNNRPFKTCEEMNDFISGSLAVDLAAGDTWIDLGDTFWKTQENEIKRVHSLIDPGVRKIKISGNHDRERYGFSEVYDILEILVEWEGKTYGLTLCHYPLVSWNGKPRGTWMIHGHTHGNIDSFNSASPDLRVDIGVDGPLAKGQSPVVSFEQVLRYMKAKANGTDNFAKYAISNCKEL